jgi:hypothetical protein
MFVWRNRNQRHVEDAIETARDIKTSGITPIRKMVSDTELLAGLGYKPNVVN